MFNILVACDFEDLEIRLGIVIAKFHAKLTAMEEMAFVGVFLRYAENSTKAKSLGKRHLSKTNDNIVRFPTYGIGLQYSENNSEFLFLPTVLDPQEFDPKVLSTLIDVVKDEKVWLLKDI